jgi:superfamily II RNA helicase
MRRLEELLREMRNAGRAIGNDKLTAAFDEARQRIKRDIVFAASLYVYVCLTCLLLIHIS